MKKIAIITAVLLLSFGVSVANARSAAEKDSTKVVFYDIEGDDVINISSDDANGRVSVKAGRTNIEVEGRNVNIERLPRKERAVTKHRGSLTVEIIPEVGVNMLPSPDYSMYPDAADHGFLELNNMRSLQWACDILELDVRLNKSRTLALKSGLSMVWDDYTFDSPDMTLVKENGMIVPRVIAGSGYKKSKINTFSLKIPVLIRFGKTRSFHAAAGGYAGVMLGTHTKVKFPKTKMRNPYLNPFYAGVTARVGYRGIYVYGNYGLTEFFKAGYGPKTSPVTVGLGWDLAL